MKRVLIIFLTLLIVAPLAFAGKKAFLVGISRYKMDWPTIHGSEDVELLKPELINQKFEVTTLTNAQATRDGIINGLNAFIKTIKKGDVIYIHFSAHGQPVEDYNGDETSKKGKKDKWDEAIVPYDAGSHFSKAYNGDKHIIDDVINTFVSDIRRILGPKGALYVVIDACHAGGSSRGDGLTRTRGIDNRGSNEGLSRSNKKFDFSNAEDERNYHLPNSRGLAPAVFFEACTAKERNKEISVKGKEYGSLSYMVYLTLIGKNGKIGSKPDAFERAVRYTVMKSTFWPKRQTLVTESSY